MQPPERPKGISKGALIAIAAGIVAVLITFRGGFKAEDVDAIPVYRTASEANRGIEESAALSIQPLKDFFSGDTLGPPQVVALERALRLLKGVVAFNPENSVTYTAVGRICFALGDYSEAEQYLREAVRLGPKEPTGDALQITAETHYLLSRTMYATRSYAAAVDEAELAIVFAPNNPDNLVARASALVQVGKSEEARRDLEKALSLNPEVPGAAALKKLIDLASGR